MSLHQVTILGHEDTQRLEKVFLCSVCVDKLLISVLTASTGADQKYQRTRHTITHTINLISP